MTPRQRPGPASSADPPEPAEDATTATPEPSVAPADPDRPAVLRVAGLHLRTGLLQLALAELEALARRDALDDAGLGDLAEARWRTGDLEAAGVVAADLVERGSSSALMLAIAAEAVAADGRTTEARRLAARALEAVEGPLDSLFAGIPRHAIWPDAPVETEGPATVSTPARLSTGLPARAGVAGSQLEHATSEGAAGVGSAPIAGEDAAAEHEIAAKDEASAAAGAYADGRGALAAGDAARAARQLGVALRLDPGFADQVLEAVGARPTDPGLALLAGDALRIVGREQEALAAFEVAREADASGADPTTAGASDPDPSSPNDGERADQDEADADRADTDSDA